MKSDLAAFLEGRLAEEEATARGAKGEEWSVDHQWSHGWRVMDKPEPSVATLVAWSPGSLMEDAAAEARVTSAHIATWDPARVLAEIAAKRILLGQAIELKELGEDDYYRAADPIDYSDIANWLICTLAELYRDHPDFDESWRT